MQKKRIPQVKSARHPGFEQKTKHSMQEKTIKEEWKSYKPAASNSWGTNKSTDIVGTFPFLFQFLYHFIVARIWTLDLTLHNLSNSK